MKFLKIKKAVLIPDEKGHTMTISTVALCDQEGKQIKCIKIKEAFEMLLSKECIIMVHENN